MKNTIKFGIFAASLLALASAVIGTTWASAGDALNVLGFETSTDWTVTGGTLLGEVDERTQGNRSISVQPSGYTVVKSRLIGPLGQVSQTISFDVKVPEQQPNPYWHGAVQLFVTVPSLNIYNRYIGQRDLTGLATGRFHQLSYELASDLRSALSAQYYDLQLSIALNVPSGVGNYLLDNLRVSQQIPANSTITSVDLPRILGFESSGDWKVGGVAASAGVQRVTQGNTSIRVGGGGYTTITSIPMVSVGPVDPALTVDLYIPDSVPAPSWAGDLQLYFSIPSLGIYNRWIGQSSLQGRQRGAFSTITFPLSTTDRADLNASTYSDLTFEFALNVPYGQAAYYLDNIRLGAVTTPPAPVTAARRGDLAGHASSGFVSVKIGEDPTLTPAITNMIVRAKSEDGWCEPSYSQVCRYYVSVIRIAAGSFEYKGKQFTHATIETEQPFRITLGGAAGTTAQIPSSATFLGLFYADEVLAQPLQPSNLRLTMSPAGDGIIHLNGELAGSVEDTQFSLSMNVTADTPLANRMPVASAGSDQTVTVTSGCKANVVLDGSQTSDVDGNLFRLTWRFRNIVVGRGEHPTVVIDKSGRWEFEVQAMDKWGSYTKASTVVTASLPASCGAL